MGWVQHQSLSFAFKLGDAVSSLRNSGLDDSLESFHCATGATRACSTYRVDIHAPISRYYKDIILEGLQMVASSYYLLIKGFNFNYIPGHVKGNVESTR